MRLTLIVCALAAATLLSAQAALAGKWTGPMGNITNNYTYNTAGADVAGTRPLTFDQGWFFDLQSHGQPVTNPTISITSGYPLSDFPGLVDFPLLQAQASLPAGADLGIALQSTLTTTGTTGYDSRRSYAPRTVPAGGGQQVITITIDVTSPRADVVVISFPPDLPGESVSCGTTTAPTGAPFSATCSVDPNGGVDWQTAINCGGCLQLNQSADFTAVINLPNSSSHPARHTPTATVTAFTTPSPLTVSGPGSGAQIGCTIGNTTPPNTTSITVPDATLDGSIPGSGIATFSIDQSLCWLGNVNDAYTVNYR